MKTIEEYTNYLFGCNFTDESFDPEDNEEHLKTSWELFEKFSWGEIFPLWMQYLQTKCSAPTDVINFVNLYVYYEASDQLVPEPMEFIGYLYSRVDMDQYWDDAGELFEGLAISVLTKAGYLNMTEAPYYNPLKDDRVLNSISRWKH